MPTIGFVGMGIMGLPMALNAKKAGFDVVVTNRSESRRKQAAEKGLTVFETPLTLAEKSDAIVIMVSDPNAVRDVLSGDNGVFKGNIKGKTLIQMSTIDEQSTYDFMDIAESKGMSFLDCPVAGSKKQVESAQLIILAGGKDEDVEKWRSLLLSMGKAIVHAGPVGKGTALKLCMNLIVAQMTTGLCESVALARTQQLDPQKIFDVIRESPAINCGYFQIKEKTLIEQDFSPAFSLENMLKDVRFMEKAAKERRLALPVTQAVRFLMEGAATEGLGKEDLTAMAKILKPKAESRN